MEGSEGVNTTSRRGVMRIAGNTLLGSTTGDWVSKFNPERFVARPGSDGESCFDVTLREFSALMLVIDS